MFQPRLTNDDIHKINDNPIEIICVLHFESGGLFHNGDIDQELAFRYAVEKINLDKTVLPRSKLSAQIERVSSQDSFHASKRGNQSTFFFFRCFFSFAANPMHVFSKLEINVKKMFF